MNTNSSASCPLLRSLLRLSPILAMAASVPAAGDELATLQSQGFAVIANTEVDASEADAFLFDGCEPEKQIPLLNGQTFVCGEDRAIADEFQPDAIILRHPTTGETRLVVAGFGFKGTLAGADAPVAQQSTGGAGLAPTPTPAAGTPATVARPAPAPAPALIAAQNPARAPTPAAQPGPKPLPPGFGNQSGGATGARPPSKVKLIAPVAGAWHANAQIGDAQADVIAQLDENGNFNRFERWSFGLVVQVWGTYTVAPISATSFQMTQTPTGWDPQQWCMQGNVCEPLKFSTSAAQFSFVDVNTVRDNNTQVLYSRQ